MCLSWENSAFPYMTGGAIHRWLEIENSKARLNPAPVSIVYGNDRADEQLQRGSYRRILYIHWGNTYLAASPISGSNNNTGIIRSYGEKSGGTSMRVYSHWAHDYTISMLFLPSSLFFSSSSTQSLKKALFFHFISLWKPYFLSLRFWSKSCYFSFRVIINIPVAS